MRMNTEGVRVKLAVGNLEGRCARAVIVMKPLAFPNSNWSRKVFWGYTPPRRKRG